MDAFDEGEAGGNEPFRPYVRVIVEEAADVVNRPLTPAAARTMVGERA